LQGANRIVTNEKNKYLTIFESLPFPVILLKANLQIDNLNHAAALFLGGKALPGAHYYGSSFDLSSKCVYDKQDEQGKPSLPDWLLAKIKIFSSEKNAQEYYFEKEVEAAGDKQIYVIQFSKMRDISGKFSGSVVMIQDFTEARKSVKEQSRMKEQLLQSDRMASIGQLAAGVAHEINNPIGFVGSNLNRLSEYTDDLVGLIANYRKFISAVEIAVYDKTELNTSLSHILQIESDADVAFLCSDIQAVIKESQEGTDRVRKIVADLKDFAQPGIAKPQFADINRCIESTVNMLSNKIKNKAEVIRNFGEIPEIFCQPCQLNQVFMSIIENAVQSIDKDGQIRIITQKNGQFIQVRISDSGCGIEPDHIKHIFEPFFTTKPVGAGTGLGLHLAYQIIKQHEGFIFVTSQPGQGTTFTIDLPLQPSCETDGE